MSSVAQETGKRQALEAKLWMGYSIQGGVVRVNVSGFDGPPTGGGMRGKVKGFSAASRKRALEKCARIEWPVVNMMCTVTTLLDFGEAEFKEKCTAWDKWIARHLEREYNIVFGAVWRDEIQPERSAREGRDCWHQHMIWPGLPWVPGSAIEPMREKLRAIFGDPDANFELTQFAGGAVGATKYVCKYVAKVAEEAAAPAEDAEGGAAGGEDVRPDHVPYSATGEGRKWGVRRRKYIPWALEMRRAVPFGPGFYRVRRAMRRKWAGVSKGRYAGAMLFVGNGIGWLPLMMGLESPGEDCVYGTV